MAVKLLDNFNHNIAILIFTNSNFGVFFGLTALKLLSLARASDVCTVQQCGLKSGAMSCKI